MEKYEKSIVMTLYRRLRIRFNGSQWHYYITKIYRHLSLAARHSVCAIEVRLSFYSRIYMGHFVVGVQNILLNWIHKESSKRTKLIIERQIKKNRTHAKTCLSFIGSNEKFQRHRFSKNSLIITSSVLVFCMYSILSTARKKKVQ